MTLVNAAISIAISIGVFVVFASLVEAARRRGIDPVGSIARMLSPDVALPPEDEALPAPELVQ